MTNKKTLFTHLMVLVLCLLGPLAWGAERTTYYHLDLLGSPVAASDPTGQVRWREEYKPYGERLLKPGASSGHTLWYTGKVHDDAVGLSYYGVRWHDPELGRFTGIDPVDVQEDNVQSFNRYAYANNNPYKYIDPDGRAGVLAPLLVFIGKEAGSEAVEQVTGVPLPTVKNAAKTTAKIARKASLKRISLKGLSQNRNLQELTHQELVKTFEGTGFNLSNHAIKRLKDSRTQSLGFKTPNDIAKVFNKGERFDAGNGEIGFSFKGLEAIVNPKNNRVVTFRPKKNREK